MTQNKQLKSAQVLVKMTPQLKAKLVKAAKGRALDTSSMARTLIAGGLAVFEAATAPEKLMRLAAGNKRFREIWNRKP
jgi:hypothetical protein